MSKTIKRLLCVVLTVFLVCSAVTVVGAVSDENDGIYTIAMQNSVTGEVFSTKAESDEMYDTVSAIFDAIPGGTYDVLVYSFNSEGGNTSLCSSTQWTCEAVSGEVDTVKVSYYEATSEIGVEITAVHPNDETIENYGYEVVLQNVDTEETFEANAEPDEMYDTVSAFFDAIPGGTYDVLVYTFNSEGGNTSLCASKQWTCEAASGEVDTVKVSYYEVTSEINVEITAVHPGTDEPVDPNKLYKVVINDVNENEIVNEYLNYTGEDSNDYPFYLTVKDLAPGNYTIQIVDANNAPVSETKTWEYTSDDSDDRVNINVLFNSLTSSLSIEELDPEPSSEYLVVVEDVQTGKIVKSQHMIADDTHYDTYYSLIEGLKNGSYKISVANFGDIISSVNWNCTIHDKNSLETIEVLYYASINEIEIKDLGKTVTEPENTDATSSTGKPSITKQSTNDTASNNITTSNGTVQTGAVSMTVVVLVLMLSAAAVAYFTRKRMV